MGVSKRNVDPKLQPSPSILRLYQDCPVGLFVVYQETMRPYYSNSNYKAATVPLRRRFDPRGTERPPALCAARLRHQRGGRGTEAPKQGGKSVLQSPNPENQHPNVLRKVFRLFVRRFSESLYLICNIEAYRTTNSLPEGSLL